MGRGASVQEVRGYLNVLAKCDFSHTLVHKEIREQLKGHSCQPQLHFAFSATLLAWKPGGGASVVLYSSRYHSFTSVTEKDGRLLWRHGGATWRLCKESVDIQPSKLVRPWELDSFQESDKS